MNEVLERYYRDERDNLLRRLNFGAGTPENAEDVLQEAFVRALTYWETFDPDHKELGAWFSTILKNCLRDFKRDEWLYGMGEDVDEVELLVEDEVADIAKQLRSLMDGKSEEHQEILSLYFEKNYSPKDIANITTTKVKTIKQIIWRFATEAKEKYGQ